MRLGVRRLVHGDPGKRTRFHDYAGNLVPPAALRFLPACLLSTAYKKITGRSPREPWLGYRAARRIEGLLQRDWRVLEFGAGNSTRWLATRSGFLLSLESEPEWLAFVAGEVSGVAHARVVLRLPPYGELQEAGEELFDFALVDGVSRDEAMRAALAHVRSGGYVYLDNADVSYPEHREARRLLLDAAIPGTVERFIDFTPGQVNVTQGLLARVTRSTGDPAEDPG